jgi:hypothetical protein
MIPLPASIMGTGTGHGVAVESPIAC